MNEVNEPCKRFASWLTFTLMNVVLLCPASFMSDCLATHTSLISERFPALNENKNGGKVHLHFISAFVSV